MALRNQPYLPLYVQDFLTDEKLRECSAQTVGVYIMIMCLMHKSQEYGKISLSKFDKRTDNITNDFANKLMKHIPFPFHTVTCSLEELLDRDVLTMENEAIIQKRMVKDNVISEKRAASGKKGGITTQSKDFAKANALPKVEANSENENENENENCFLVPKLLKIWKTKFPNYPAEPHKDFEPLRLIGEFIANQKGLSIETDVHQISETFENIAMAVKADDWWANKPLSSIEKKVQEFYARANVKREKKMVL